MATKAAGRPTRNAVAKPVSSTRTWIWSLLPTLFAVSSFFVYRHLSNGPYKPHLCAFFNHCPEWPISTSNLAPGFESVRDAFLENFEAGEEVGASFYAWVDGKPVVELVGGFYDRDYDQNKPLTEDHLSLVFSSSKAVTSFAVAHLVSQGRLKYTDKISTHWPEFAQGNKENVTVADLMGHRAGVSFLDADRAPYPEEILDLDAFAIKLAAQPHNFGGKTTMGYHAVTRGWYINELVRRVDAKNRSLGTYLREEITGPLDIPYHLGLPESLHSKVSPLNGYPTLSLLFHILTPKSWQSEPVPDVLLKTLLDRKSLPHKSLMGSGPVFPWYEMWPAGQNRPEIWQGESGSFSGMTNAKGLSRFAAILANNGTDPLTKKVVIPASTLTEALAPLPVIPDVVLGHALPFVVGGWGAVKTLVHNETWHGWAGAGGSMIWFKPSENLAFGYVPNAMKLQSLGDARSWHVFKEFLDCVDRSKGRNIDTGGRRVAGLDGMRRKVQRRNKAGVKVDTGDTAL
ncbi:beta-lactamase/transpeptidase-like protein [Phlyctochytrium arcticum]|nr:beta-lactamase/transpeptidase-like protein [Phlyctochytrium arcticum]